MTSCFTTNLSQNTISKSISYPNIQDIGANYCLTTSFTLFQPAEIHISTNDFFGAMNFSTYFNRINERQSCVLYCLQIPGSSKRNNHGDPILLGEIDISSSSNLYQYTYDILTVIGLPAMSTQLWPESGTILCYPQPAPEEPWTTYCFQQSLWASSTNTVLEVSFLTSCGGAIIDTWSWGINFPGSHSISPFFCTSINSGPSAFNIASSSDFQINTDYNDIQTIYAFEWY